MSNDPCDACQSFDRVCNLDCGVGFDDPALAGCELDEIDCRFDDVCEVENNCGFDDTCNDECGQGNLAACDEDFDCDRFEDSIFLIIGPAIAGTLIFFIFAGLVITQYRRIASLKLKPNENAQPYVPPQGAYVPPQDAHVPPQGAYVPPQEEHVPEARQVDAWAS